MKNQSPLHTHTSNLHLTLRAWPVIAIATIGLCFLTELVAGWFGVKLAEQANIDLVRRCLANAFSSNRAFLNAAFLVAQVVIILPAIEELIFRWLLFKQQGKLFGFMRERLAVARETRETGSLKSLLPLSSLLPLIISSSLFSAAHYIAQPWPDNAFLALVFFGCAQCWLYARTGRLWCAMMNHALFNLTNLVLLFVVPEI